MQTASLWFRPLKSDPSKHTILAFDVEGTGGEGGFVCGSIVGSSTCEFYTEPESMFDSILAHGAQGDWLFSHNLEYDLPLVAGSRLFDGELIFKPQGILRAEYQHWGRKVKLYDSLNLFPRWKVSELGDMVELPKLELDDDLKNLIRAGVPWSGLIPEDRELIRTYCIRDAEIVYRAVTMLQEELHRLGGELKQTIAGVSMDLYRRRFHKWPWKAIGEQTNKLTRGAFYGGRTENFRVGVVEGVNLYDINSLYPYAQRTTSFPHPNSTRLLIAPRASEVLENFEGVVSATVTVDERFIPPLPTRLDHKLFFPTGTFRGEWTALELREAAQRGIQVDSIEWALGSRTTFNPFDEFVRVLWGERARQICDGDPRHYVVKLIMNSLYGRFGLDTSKGLFRMVRVPEEPDWEELKGYQTSGFAGELVAFGPIDDMRFPSYVNVMFAAQVSAAARLHLLDELERHDVDAVYCDTDSIITSGTIKTGDDLGEWKAQMTDGSVDLLGPKEYALHNEVFGDKYIAKGVPEKVAREYVMQGAARFRRALKVREALYQGKNPSEWVEVFRERRPTVPKRVPALTQWEQEGPNVLTTPWEYPQLLEYVQRPTDRQAAAKASRALEYVPVWVRLAAEQRGLPPDLLAGELADYCLP